jgi:hypothetical protein
VFRPADTVLRLPCDVLRVPRDVFWVRRALLRLPWDVLRSRFAMRRAPVHSRWVATKPPPLQALGLGLDSFETCERRDVPRSGSSSSGL